MDSRKTEAENAVEMMELLYSKLENNTVHEKTLRKSMDKLMMIFKSDLFSALIDIQGYYEETIEVGEKSRQFLLHNPLPTQPQQPRHTLPQQPVAPPPQQPINSLPPPTKPKPKMPVQTEPLEPMPEPPKTKEKPKKKKKSRTPDPADDNLSDHGFPPPPVPSQFFPQEYPPHHEMEDFPSPPPDSFPRSDDPQSPMQEEVALPGNEWDYEDIQFNRSSAGFGFSIAGGFDAPQPNGDPSIIVSKIIPGGAAHQDGRLRLYDIIMAVNDVGLEYVSHDEAVDSLKKSGKTLHLVVRRLREGFISPDGSHGGGGALSQPQADDLLMVELVKRPEGGGLGFTIASCEEGGVAVSKVVPGGLAEEDGHLQVTDKIVQVDDTNIEFASHSDCVSALKATGNVVRLLVRTTAYPEGDHQEHEDAYPQEKSKKGKKETKSDHQEPSGDSKKHKGLSGLFKKSKK